MLNSFLLGTLAALLVAAPPFPEAHAATDAWVSKATCPEDHPDLRSRVVGMLTNPALAWVRQRDGWAVDPNQLRVLSDTKDASVCQLLRDNLQFPDSQRITAYYTAGGLYFVATERTTAPPPGTMIVSRWEPLFVLRSDLSLVGSYAN